MDIEGLGERIVQLLVAEGKVADVADLYRLTSDDLLQFRGFGEKSVANLLSAIDSSRHRPLANLLIGLGIEHLGPTTVETLARQFRSLEALMDATAEDIAAVDGIGPTIAASVARFLADDANRAVVGELRAAGVATDIVEGAHLEQTLAGKSVVVTGTLDGFSRDEAEAAIRDRGGKSPGSVSKSTFAVVVGEGAGQSKLTRAEQLDVVQIDEVAFRHLLENGELPAR